MQISRILFFLFSLYLLTSCGKNDTAVPPAIPAASNKAGLEPHKVMHDNIMGTYASTTFWCSEEEAVAADHAVMDVFNAINARFSTWIDDSEMIRLNASAAKEPFVCSDSMWELLSHARRAYDVSDGGFDISAGPLMKLWGFYRRRKTLPSQEEIDKAKAKVGLNKVVFDEEKKTVFFTVEGMALDSGGIVKGWALDLAAQKVQAMGVSRGLIDLGGNILVLSEPPPERKAYRIAIRDPRHQGQYTQSLGIVETTGRAISTSGDYERFVDIDGTRYSHIMDPRTGKPVTGIAAVSVLAPSGVVSDFLSTTIFVNQGQGMDELLKEFNNLSIALVRMDENGKLSLETYGPGLEDIKESPAW